MDIKSILVLYVKKEGLLRALAVMIILMQKTLILKLQLV